MTKRTFSKSVPGPDVQRGVFASRLRLGQTCVRTVLLVMVATIDVHSAPPAAKWEPRSQVSQGVIEEINLASDTAWTLSIDGGVSRAIKVPGGGYNSDLQDKPWIEEKSVKDHVVYQRSITIPKVCKGQVSVVEFGAVNYGAEVYLIEGTNETLVTTHVGPMMPITADLTHLVVPGGTYTLKVKSFEIAHYGVKDAPVVPTGFHYDEAWKKPGKGWGSRFAAGITKYVRLAIYPEVRVSDVFVRPSVTRSELAYDVWIRNHTAVPRTITVTGSLDSWNGDAWKYPVLPDTQVTIPADSEMKVTIGPVNWSLGPTSYWWPNQPFREDYRAKLHNLTLTLLEDRLTLARRTQRFGFVEWTEGPFYYCVNGVRMNFISDSTPESGMSSYDCYSTSPAFLDPGCAETWKRYMRLGINCNRTHQATPTPYMMDVADEVGFTLIPETGIRGGGHKQTYSEHMAHAALDLALMCRNHPSVCRYSLSNEWDPRPALGDAIVQGDDTRPLVYESNQASNSVPRRIDGANSHAYIMQHYQKYSVPVNTIAGMGECAWNANGLENVGLQGMDMRRKDVAYFSGWDWINYWPNFLEGMSYDRHAWKQSTHADRKDAVDGWNSPVIRWIQKCFHPYLVMDVAFTEANGQFKEGWPSQIPACKAGGKIERNLEIFNGGLTGDRLTVQWTARWDSANGAIGEKGSIADLPIKPGFHSLQKITFTVPEPGRYKRRLYLVIESLKEGETVFCEEGVCFDVFGKEAESAALFPRTH